MTQRIGESALGVARRVESSGTGDAYREPEEHVGWIGVLVSAMTRSVLPSYR
jgi:hypothetical protein